MTERPLGAPAPARIDMFEVLTAFYTPHVGEIFRLANSPSD
jgi:hypothetical protein